MRTRKGIPFVTLAWHAVSVLLILALPSWLDFAIPFWALPPPKKWLAVALAGAYVAAAIASHVRDRFAAIPKILIPAAFAAVALSVVFFGMLLVPSVEYSRRLVVAGSFLVVACSVASTVALRIGAWRLRESAVLVVLLLAILAPLLLLSRGTWDKPRQRHVTLSASQQIITADYYADYFPERGPSPPTGGAIARSPDGDGYLLVTARGDLFHFSWDDRDNFRVVDLKSRVPINGAEFDADATAGVSTRGFRAAGIVVRRNGSASRIFVSHHYWKRDQKCFVVRVSSHAWPLAQEASAGSGEEWRTLFESRPCLPIAPARGVAFVGEQIGGKMQFLDDRHLLLTVGDHQFDGWYKPTDYVQDLNAHYGKTLLIDVESGESTLFTIGHRNPQGLAIDARGRIWLTEHGPKGGDELNLLTRGGNYGYPYHSYGTEYGGVTWPPAEQAGIDRKKFILPLFAWVPSIGISEVVSVADPAFERWRDDLLIASLRGRAIWRVRVEENRVVYAEPIDVGERVRDIVAGPGEFVLWTDSDTVVRIRPAQDLNDGAVVFTLKCAGCHKIGEHRIGPNLEGILGRSVASARGYNYSPALKQVEGRWTEERLSTFLSDPRSFAPGTMMAIDGISDPDQRRNVIRYIKQYY